jgi:hypothetical protein
MFRKRIFIISIIILFFGAFKSYAETLDVNVRIRNDLSDEKLINRTNLTTIKQFIIKKGFRETYCQLYNNNPAYHSKRFAFYLNPDTRQQNINCEIDKSDFQTLVVRGPDTLSGKNQYYYISFNNEQYTEISIPWPAEDLSILQIREFAVESLKEILSDIEKDTPVTKPKTMLRSDTRNLQEAIDIAIPALYKDANLPTIDNPLYILTSVKQIIIKNKYIWRVTFKPRELLPVDPSKGGLGLGGEVFVNVDLSTKKTEISYGE